MTSDNNKDNPEDKKEKLLDRVVVRQVISEDIDRLRSILSAWIRDSETGEILTDEISEIINRIKMSIDSKNDYYYFVAESVKTGVIGIVGYRPPEGPITKYIQTKKPAEGVNIFVDPNSCGKGVGKKLIEALITDARMKGFREILFDSGPRYKDTGWHFHDTYAERVGIMQDRYGPGLHAPVWRIDLNKDAD